MHICNDKNKFYEFSDYNSSVTIANGQELNSLGHGSIRLTTTTSENTNSTITLKNVLYVPEIESNLISIRKAIENGCVANLKKSYVK